MLSCLSCVQLFATLWIVAHQASLSMRFSRQEYWSGLSCPSPGDLPDPGIKPTSLISPALADKLFTTSATSVQFSSLTQLCPTLRPHGLQHTRLPCPSPAPQSLFKLMSIKLVMPSNHLILLLLPSIFPSSRVFSNASILRIGWAE